MGGGAGFRFLGFSRHEGGNGCGVGINLVANLGWEVEEARGTETRCQYKR